MDEMMTWINQIVMFVLLASIVDLMIPHSKFTKYVRFVIGFIFILIFINPLFALFGPDLSGEINQLIDKIYESAINADMKKTIQFKISDSQSQREGYVVDKMHVHLKEKVQTKLQKSLNEQIDKLECSFEEELESSPENLEQINVVIEASET